MIAERLIGGDMKGLEKFINKYCRWLHKSNGDWVYPAIAGSATCGYV